ncbi:MAG: TIGR00341 family protein [Bacteroidales bacterium]|nr:TIGR00341 family protein [Bacteroidales bacterium]
MKLPHLTNLSQAIKSYFTLTDFLIPQAEAEEAIREGVSFRGINILILIVAIFIASLGLNTNSTAVIIGAMLISPLMGPIIGMGLAVGVRDFELMKQSFRNLAMAALFSILASTIYFLISPVNEGHSELLARTSPTIYDVFIVFFGGAAGILAIGSKVKGNVIPGVAIATALMPPLCTVGYGLATWQPKYFMGAFFLFFINSVFIAVATLVGVKLMKYHIHDFTNPERARRVRNIVYTVAILTMLPACYMTYEMYRQSSFSMNCSRFVDSEFQFDGTQVLTHKAIYNKGADTLAVTLVGRVLPQDSLILALTEKLPQFHLGGTVLRIFQGDAMAPVDMQKTTSGMLSDLYQVTQNTITRQQNEIDSLRLINAMTARNDTISAIIAPEIKVLFPQIKDIAVSRAIVTNIEHNTLDTLNVVMITPTARLSQAELSKFKAYMEARLKTPRVTILNLRQ